jgi:hypothetical protein
MHKTQTKLTNPTQKNFVKLLVGNFKMTFHAFDTSINVEGIVKLPLNSSETTKHDGSRRKFGRSFGFNCLCGSSNTLLRETGAPAFQHSNIQLPR